MESLQIIISIAKKLVQTRTPDCEAAFLAGSVVRGEATATSDLDIVVFDSSVTASYRESFFYEGWPIEWYVHNLDSYHAFYESDCARAKPSLPKMVSEGIVLYDKGKASVLQYEAKSLLKKGPSRWGEKEIDLKRYFLTDVLEDFIGATDRGEEMCCAASLVEQVHEFILRTNGQWVGSSKWIVRALHNYDTNLAAKFVHAFDHYYKTNEKESIISFVDDALQPYGGRLFDGFSLGK
ncbi:nucleotidyltransferase domain-containing protein [Guptibacillus spartinae]|uniref:nucleotidyltransferase domain-containing protein n=1 Tax=Guptibacillus spartinae TaxID=3025679 RepID=UPI002360C80D|nr:nucleotidyltransferase domain-containing protein [Pseudalkalibacillus spartinae]